MSYTHSLSAPLQRTFNTGQTDLAANGHDRARRRDSAWRELRFKLKYTLVRAHRFYSARLRNEHSRIRRDSKRLRLRRRRERCRPIQHRHTDTPISAIRGEGLENAHKARTALDLLHLVVEPCGVDFPVGRAGKAGDERGMAVPRELRVRAICEREYPAVCSTREEGRRRC